MVRILASHPEPVLIDSFVYFNPPVHELFQGPSSSEAPLRVGVAALPTVTVKFNPLA